MRCGKGTRFIPANCRFFLPAVAKYRQAGNDSKQACTLIALFTALGPWNSALESYPSSVFLVELVDLNETETNLQRILLVVDFSGVPVLIARVKRSPGRLEFYCPGPTRFGVI